MCASWEKGFFGGKGESVADGREEEGWNERKGGREKQEDKEKWDAPLEAPCHAVLIIYCEVPWWSFLLHSHSSASAVQSLNFSVLLNFSFCFILSNLLPVAFCFSLISFFFLCVFLSYCDYEPIPLLSVWCSVVLTSHCNGWLWC